jgi:hypothetical protein
MAQMSESMATGGLLDAAFVAIDVEGFDCPSKRKHRDLFPQYVGIATSDSRDVVHESPQLDSAATISTQFLHRRPLHQSSIQQSRKFYFGKSRQMCETELQGFLRGVFRRIDPTKSAVSVRNIIIVGHEMQGNFNVLKRIGLIPKDFAPVLGILDTQILAQAMFG